VTRQNRIRWGVLDSFIVYGFNVIITFKIIRLNSLELKFLEISYLPSVIKREVLASLFQDGPKCFHSTI
jgi:hypothetical protein